MDIRLLALPTEVIATTLDFLKDKEDAREYSTKVIASIRLTCKSLECICHTCFLECLYQWEIDPTKEDQVSKLVDASKSPIHATAITTILFMYKGKRVNYRSLLGLQHAFTNLASLKHGVAIGINPFGSTKVNEATRERDIVHFLDRIFVIAVASQLEVKNIIVQARRAHWNRVDRHSLEEREVLPWTDYDQILLLLRHLLEESAWDNSSDGLIAPQLIADYPTQGQISYNYPEHRLNFEGLPTRHWTYSWSWAAVLRPTTIAIHDCRLEPDELLDTLNRYDRGGTRYAASP